MLDKTQNAVYTYIIKKGCTINGLLFPFRFDCFFEQPPLPGSLAVVSLTIYP